MSLIEYPKILALEKVHPFFEAHQGMVRIEEKIDGSNVGIRVDRGELEVQSRTTILDLEKPGMFKRVVDWANEVHSSWPTDNAATLYGEMVGSGKLRYSKESPPFILFDVRRDYGEVDVVWATHEGLTTGAQLYGIPRVPVLYYGPYQGIDHVKSFLGKSNYGDLDMEGVVVKATNVRCWYTRASDNEVVYYTDPLLCGKVVTEEFKETKAPKTSIKSVEEPLVVIAESVVTPARIKKAKQRAAEEGKGENVRPHILIPYVLKDIHDEDKSFVSELLFDAYWRKLSGPISKRVVELA